MGTAKGEGYNSKNAGTIKSIDTAINGFGTLMQNCLAGNYVGKRVRMSGFVKTKDADTALLWLRVDAIDSTSQKDSVTSITLGLSNMRPISGTTDWKKYDIVMDVPSHASRLAFGGTLSHTGRMWFDNLSFEIVDNTVHTTSTIPEEWQKSKMTRKQFEENTRSRPPQLLPTNLNFEE